jgi:hypothetical protein
MERYDPRMDARCDSALMAGASATAFTSGSSTPAGSLLTIQSVREFLADRPEVTRYVLIGLFDDNLIEFLRIGNRFFIPDGAWERHLEWGAFPGSGLPLLSSTAGSISVSAISARKRR